MDPEGLTSMLIPRDTDAVPREKFVDRSTMTSPDDLQEHVSSSAPHHVLYTAIPVSMPDASLIFRHRADSTSETSSISLEDEEISDTSSSGASVKAFQTYSAVLGLLVGCFIQLSSLGANYLLAELYHDNKPSPQTIVRYSLFWSVLTSVMGVTILFLVRELVMVAYKANQVTRNISIVLHLECYFAIGTLTGVCLAWTCTDVMLGFRAHFLHSIGTLLAALIWCKCITGFFAPEAACEDDAQVPLLKEVPSLTEDEVDENAMELVNSSRFKLSSLALGLVTGLFIQFSSLGANFALSHFVLPSHPEPSVVAAFSLVWSIVTSGMGTLILTLARGMIVHIFSTDRREQHPSDDCDDADGIMEPSLLRLELYFAVGALLGVNLAWMATDVVMGLKVHHIHALVTEILVILAVALTTLRCSKNSASQRQRQESQRKVLYDPYYTQQV